MGASVPILGQNDPATRRRRRRRWVWLLVVGLFSAVLLLIFLIEWNAQRIADEKLEELVARLRAEGHPVEFADLDPAKQGKSTAGGAQLLQLIGQLNPRLDEMCRAFSQDERPADPAFEKLLAENGAQLDAIVAFVADQEIFFPRPFQSGALSDGALGMDAIGSTRMVMRCLAAKQRLAIDANDVPAAVEGTRQMLVFASVYQHERMLVHCMVRMALMGMAIDGVEKLVRQLAIEEPAQQSFDHQLFQLEEAFRLGPILRGEGAYIRSAVSESYGTRWQDRLARKLFGLQENWRKLGQLIGNSDSEEYLALWAMYHWAHAADQQGPRGLAAIDAARQEIGNRTVAFPESYSSVAGWASSLKSSLLVRQRLVNARLGLRVDRYYREHGALPENLEQLVDEALPEIPPGLYSGGVPTYERPEHGFRIHDGPLAEDIADDRFEVIYEVTEAATQADGAE